MPHKAISWYTLDGEMIQVYAHEQIIYIILVVYTSKQAKSLYTIHGEGVVA